MQVSQIIPSDGSADVETDAAFTILFNRPVVPLVSTGQQGDLPNPLEISPAIEGKGEWVSTSIYRFTPAEALAGATTYNVTVKAGLQDIVGGLLADDVNASFATFAPAVVKIEPNNLNRIAPEDAIKITFNMPMDTDSVLSALDVNPSTLATGCAGKKMGVC